MRAVDDALAAIGERAPQDAEATLAVHPSAAQPQRDSLTAALDALSGASAPFEEPVAVYLTALQAVKDSHSAVEAQKAQAAADAAAEAARESAEYPAGGGDSGNSGGGGIPIQWGPTGLRTYQPPPFDPGIAIEGEFWDGCRGLPIGGSSQVAEMPGVFELPWTYTIEGGVVTYIRCIEPLCTRP